MLKDEIECKKKTKLKNLKKKIKTIKRIRIKSDRKKIIKGEIAKKIML